ncbi:hypothetical protein WMF45_06120 [Sorangium sp. So ce448]|uniref:hypothetical protein n=1 Tax=Sorangium sp. So ce448 TaxID=3133314 RepID=UPI003F604A49
MKRINIIIGMLAAPLACLGGAQLASAAPTTPVEELVLIAETRAPIAADAPSARPARQRPWYASWHGHWYRPWHGYWHGHWYRPWHGYWHGHWHGHWHGLWYGHWR